MEKIVFLDASTVDYRDIDLSPLSDLGDFTAYDVTQPDETVNRSGGASIIITNKVVIDREIMDSCPDLKLIAVAATGYNIIDLEAAREKNISVANVAGYSTHSVAQLTLSFMLCMATNIIRYNESAHNGTWSASPIFTLGNWPGFELRGKTAGILGFGTIGREVARLCSQFGMKVVALKRPGEEYEDCTQRLTLDELAAVSDFISIHMPLTEYSQGIIDQDFLKKMKKTAYLINMARGPVVCPEALSEALHSGEIAGAAFDVMVTEPPDKHDPLLSAPNCIITPHIGWASIESRKLLVREIAENIRSFIKGEKRNIVSY